MIGIHTVTITPASGGAAVDVSCFVDRVTIHFGRDDTDSQPDANSCTLDMAIDTDTDTYPAALDVGGRVSVTTAVAGNAPVTRFIGAISDISQVWEPAGEDTPNRESLQVIATGPLAALGRRVVGDTPWAQELDGARVAKVLAAAGVVLDPLYSDPGTVQVLARDVDSQPALDVAQGTAQDAGGVLWSTLRGEIRYADANHRRGTVAGLVLDACDVLVTPRWLRNTSGLINRVSIGYGVAPSGTDQPRFTDERADSIAKFGRYEYVTGTQLAAQADAAAMGTMLLTRNSAPVWIMDELPVDVEGLSAAETASLLALEMHSLVSLTGLPAAGTAPTSAYLWVEGWEETLEWGIHELTLAVSGYCRTVPPPRWNDTPPEKTWDTIGAITWDDAACFGPTPNLGRWDDTPASLRWDQIPPATTWNNYV